jgi:hypothetical protein
VDIIDPITVQGTLARDRRFRKGVCSAVRHVLLIALALILIAVPSSAGTGAGMPAGTAPGAVNISIYVVDFNRFDVEAGSVGVDCYLELTADHPVSIDDVELMNGMMTSVSIVNDTPNAKEYRVIAVLVSEPDLRRFPFDHHSLAIKIEPKNRNEQEMVLAIDPATSGLSPEADLPGWTITGSRFAVTNTSYLPGETPYSRAVFEYGITRDATSTLLKFFLPIFLIVLVSLSSLVMKVSSRLGLNASMFLAAVLIHWRVADAIPLVSYATFLDLFMIITYGTLVMVLISGILILKFTESGDTGRAGSVHSWSLRLIPPLAIALYLILIFTYLS